MDESDWDKSNLLALLRAEEPDWERAQTRLKEQPHEAFLVDPVSSLTPLHYAVIRRATAPESSYVMSLIRGIALVNPEAGETQCSALGYTPLAYACDSTSPDYDDLAFDAQVISTLHEVNDIAMDVTSKRGHPPLSIHILAISRRKFLDHSTREVAGFASPVLTTLLQKSSQEDMVNALETLYSCNTVAIMQRFAAEEARKRRNLESKGLDSWWVLSCMVFILKAIDFEGSENNEGGAGGRGGGDGTGAGGGDGGGNGGYGDNPSDGVYFSPLHTLSAIKDCPTPFLILAMRAAEEDVKTQDHATGNLPIHNVASWSLPEEDPVCRKSMGWTSLLNADPESVDEKNDYGETPTDVQEKSGTFV